MRFCKIKSCRHEISEIFFLSSTLISRKKYFEVVDRKYENQFQVKRYDFFFIVTLCSSSLENAALSSGCSRRPGDSCSFSCAEGYNPLNSNNLVCGSDGTWNQDTNNLCSSEIKSEHEYALLHVIFAKNLNEILY